VGRKWPIPMPPEAIVKDLPSAWTQEGEDVLEIRSRARHRAERRRIEGASPRGEKSDACDTGPDLEPSRVEVSVRNAVTREVESRPQQESREPRAAGRAGRSACRHVEGNDHRVLSSRMSAAASRRFRRLPVSCGGDSGSSCLRARRRSCRSDLSWRLRTREQTWQPSRDGLGRRSVSLCWDHSAGVFHPLLGAEADTRLAARRGLLWLVQPAGLQLPLQTRR
jgi:hypothetical protein